MMFKVGMNVICINNECLPKRLAGTLSKGKSYKIISIDRNILEINNDLNDYISYFWYRFEPACSEQYCLSIGIL